MSKPKDPVISVLDYFEKTDLALARQTLTIVGQIVRRRSPGGSTPGAAKPRTRTKPVATAPAGTAGPD